MVSWYALGGVEALFWMQGPPQADFGATKKRCLRRRARLVVGPTYGGAGQKDLDKKPKKVEKVKKKVFSNKHVEFPHDSGKSSFFGFLDRFDPLLAIFTVVLGHGVVGPT